MRLKKFEQKILDSQLFGVLHYMHRTLQVMKIPTFMELRISESGLQMILYFKGQRNPPYHPGTSL